MVSRVTSAEDLVVEFGPGHMFRGSRFVAERKGVIRCADTNYGFAGFDMALHMGQLLLGQHASAHTDQEHVGILDGSYARNVVQFFVVAEDERHSEVLAKDIRCEKR